MNVELKKRDVPALMQAVLDFCRTCVTAEGFVTPLYVGINGTNGNTFSFYLHAIDNERGFEVEPIDARTDTTIPAMVMVRDRNGAGRIALMGVDCEVDVAAVMATAGGGSGALH